MATLILSETGANVIKVERPNSWGGMRNFFPQLYNKNITFAMLNQKINLSIKLKDPRQRRLLSPLIKEVDIIFEQFQPGVMDRLNLAYKAISAIKPNIIYYSIKGSGQTGPKKNITGHDLNYIGDSGLLALSIGLRLRDKTGQGSYIDISMTECLFPFLYWAIGQGIGADRWSKSGDSLFTGGSPWYNLYKTRDNKFLAAASLEQKFWNKFCKTINLEKILRNDSIDPSLTINRIGQIIFSKNSKHWETIFLKANWCCPIVKTAKDAISVPQTQERQVFSQKFQTDSGKLFPALPVPIIPALRYKKNVSKAPKLGNFDKSLITLP